MHEEDEAFEALRMYVEDELNSIPQEYVGELYKRYGGDPETEYEVHRGLTFQTSTSYSQFLEATNETKLVVGDKPQSFSTHRPTARQFAHSRKTNGNSAIAMMVSEQLRNGEIVAGHRGVLLSGKVRGDQVIDIGKAGFISEAEVLVMPNEALNIELETFIPLQELADEAESPEEKLSLYRTTNNTDLKNYIFLNHSDVLEADDISAILEPAMEEYQKSNKSRYHSILNADSGTSKGEGYLYSKIELNPVRRKNLTQFHQYNVITEAGNGFVIKENMSTDLSLRRDRSLETISVDAVLPDGLIELFEKGGMLNPEQIDLLENIYKGIANDLIKLAEDFKIDTLEPRLQDDLKVVNIPSHTKELSVILKRNIGERYNARNAVDRVSTTEQMKKDSAKITDTVLSLINAAIKSEEQSNEASTQEKTKTRSLNIRP